jgi:hypothetical protein
MESAKTDILSDISSLSRIIEDQYPELQKYLDETRSTLPQGDFDGKEIQKKIFEDYRDSLKDLIQRYQKGKKSNK